MKKVALVVSLLFVVLSVSTNALSDDVSAQIRSLQQQIQALRESSINSNVGTAQAGANLQEFQSQIDALKGSVEANAHMIRTLTDNVDVRFSDTTSRIGAMEERLSIQGRQVTAAISTVAPEAAKEAELYQLSLNQINNSEFIKAIATLKGFLKKFPESDYVGNAKYWLGECYFAMRDYETAIKEFEQFKKKYPRSDKMPTALLKQGYAFASLNMDGDAKLFFNTLVRKYPRSREAKEAKDYLERSKDIKTPTSQHGIANTPLAPGVKIDEKAQKNASEKYR